MLFDFYNFRYTSLFIRYYHIPLRLYDIREFEYVLSVNFNGFLGLVYTNQKRKDIPAFHYFSILSYINSEDSSLITLESNTKLLLSTYINEQHIENNIFGVILYGIKILKLPKNLGIYYLSENKNNIFSENDILDPDDSIIFVYDYTELIKNESIYTIEIAGVVQEPLYAEFNKYPENIEFLEQKIKNYFINKEY